MGAWVKKKHIRLAKKIKDQSLTAMLLHYRQLNPGQFKDDLSLHVDANVLKLQDNRLLAFSDSDKDEKKMEIKEEKKDEDVLSPLTRKHAW